MYKQIFTPPITETYIEGEALEEMREQLKDALFMERCTELTYMMLKNKMDINTITAIIKEYQTKYFYIKRTPLN